MNILLLYNSTQTFTNTVYEHLACFAEHSRHRVFFAHVDAFVELNIKLGAFDAIGIHYTIRLPFDQVSPSVSEVLVGYKGLKFLFIQDEYDHSKRAWYWINKLGMQLVFTVVPEAGIGTVYPKDEFPHTRFVTNLTGYVPERLPSFHLLPLPSERSLFVGYRGRPLPIRYGQLGVEKVAIGKIVKSYCDQLGVSNDIAWSEDARIYGPKWYDFVVSCRSMLGSESGSNVFDWDGTLSQKVEQYRNENSGVSEQHIYRHVIRPKEIDGLMNQLSPRVFEAIASKTVLILFEGEYSGVIRPGEHFIALKKDGSNLADVVQLLKDETYVDAMADRAWRDIIGSGNYSYKSFVGMVDGEIERSLSELGGVAGVTHRASTMQTHIDFWTPITTSPIRAQPPPRLNDTFMQLLNASRGPRDFAKRFAIYAWRKLPESVRLIWNPRLIRLIGRG
jgi:hypothetical protein